MRRSPRHRVYRACSQDPGRQRLRLGTSVGWSDIYPSDYDRQWVSVAGLRGCYAFVMRVDPQNLLYESNERNNRSVRIVRLPYRGGPSTAEAPQRRSRQIEAIRAARSPTESPPSRRICHSPPSSISVMSTTVEGRPVSCAPVDRQVDGVDDRRRGDLVEDRGRRLAAEVRRGLEDRAHRARERAADQPHAEPLGVLAAGERVAALGVGDDQGHRPGQQRPGRLGGARPEARRAARASPAARSRGPPTACRRRGP